MLIEDIRKRRGRMVALISGGQEVLRLDADIALDEHVRCGREYSQQELERLSSLSDKQRAKRRAYYLLAYRDHSRAELERKLKRTASEEAAQEAVEKMEQLRLLDDEGYARSLAQRLYGYKLYGARRVLQELIQKGIPKELAVRVTDELEPDPHEQLSVLLSGKFSRSLSDEKGRKRTVAALARYGYSWSDIREAMRGIEPDEDGG